MKDITAIQKVARVKTFSRDWTKYTRTFFLRKQDLLFNENQHLLPLTGEGYFSCFDVGVGAT